MMTLSFDPSGFGSKKAIRCKGQAIDYISFDEKIGRFAAGLKQLGIKKGDRVAVILNNSPEFVICFFALARIGAIAVLINTKSTEDELRYYISDSMPAAVVFDSAFKEIILNKDLGGRSHLHYIIVGGPEGYGGYNSFNGLLSCGTPLREITELSPEAELIWQYSTGSTGRPKRVCRTHYHLSTEVNHFTDTVKINRDDNFMAVVPMFHSHGLCNSMLASLYNGCTLTIIDEFIPRDVLLCIERHHITIFPGVPFMFKMLSETYLKQAIDLSCLRLCFSAGANLPIEVSRNFHNRFGRYVFQLYGSTETGSVSISLPDADNALIEKTLESAGLPMKGVQVKIFDENGDTLKTGETGEIGIKSRAAISSYPDLYRENIESFHDGYFFPGDTGRIDHDGRLYISGRKKLMINVSGNKVDPVEVENIIKSRGGIKEVVVLGTHDAISGEIVKAVIVSEEDISMEEVTSFCRGKLSEYKIPKIVEFRSEIPKSPLGKILRKYLQ